MMIQIPESCADQLPTAAPVFPPPFQFGQQAPARTPAPAAQTPPKWQVGRIILNPPRITAR